MLSYMWILSYGFLVTLLFQENTIDVAKIHKETSYMLEYMLLDKKKIFESSSSNSRATQLPSSIATMALQIHHVCRPIPPLSSTGLLSSWPSKQFTIGRDVHRSFALTKAINSKTRKNLRSSVRVKSSLETSGPTAVVGQVTEVDKDTFWPIVNSAGDKTVVLDMYTQWCGPCKIIAPKFQELAEKYLDVVFLKLDCNQDNKPLAKELGIKVVPTFKILKHGKIVKEVTGAKFDNLFAAMEEVRSS
ncbi:hypothetical protein L1887_21756 [Cichorium endivia]|nr:hypothetical protein L1887_21756 [Cichorium endivia]